MKSKTPKYRSLSQRIVVQFCLMTVGLSLFFGMLSFLFLYVVEDGFIVKSIAREARYLEAEYQASGSWPEPRTSNMSLHQSKQSFPDDIRDIALQEPHRSEFYGEEGKHYHAYELEAYPGVYLVAEVSADLQVRKIKHGVITFLIIATLIVTFVACFIAWLLARKTTKPLQQLVQLVDGVAPEQIPDKFAAQFPNDEVGLLASTLEHTLGRIGEALEREKCFTRDASHELRTPLAVIKNAVELYRSKNAKDENNGAILDRIYDAATQMQKTVQALLVLARGEHNAALKQKVQLMPVLETAILDNRLLLEGKNVEIEVSESCDTEVLAAPEMLKVLLDNLLSNAFQFTSEGMVRLWWQKGSLHIQDSGPGIEAEISDKIMDVGVKGAQSTGFGFGLSIVKRLCDHQGWSLAVEAQKGTTVTVVFS